MEIVADTSAIVAVLLEEPERDALVEAATAYELIAPPSVHWEIGNAFSAMFKQGRLSVQKMWRALESYENIPIRFSEIELVRALEIAHECKIYAYDAYVIACALKHRCGVLSIDRGLKRAANGAGVKTVEIRV